jgi:uncharacterized protein YcnI
VKPEGQVGWNLTINERDVQNVTVGENGQNITKETDTVTWDQGTLRANEYLDFGLLFKLPESEDGTEYYFPVLQQCVVGTNNWNQTPADGTKLAAPAPKFTVFANGTLIKANTDANQTGKTSSALGLVSGSMSVYFWLLFCLFD